MNIIGISGKLENGKSTVGKIIRFLTRTHALNIELTKTDITDNQWIEVLDAKGTSIWKIKMFADKLKDIVCLLIGCTREQLEDHEFKNKELGEEWTIYKVLDHSFNDEVLDVFTNKEKAEIEWSNKELYIIKEIHLSPEKLMELLETNCGRQIIHPNIWINSLFSDYVGDNVFTLSENLVNEKDSSGTQELVYPNWIITDVRFPNEVKAIKNRGGIVIRVNRPLHPGVAFTTDTQKHLSEIALDNYEDFDYIIDNFGTIDNLIEEVKKILVKEKIL